MQQRRRAAALGKDAGVQARFQGGCEQGAGLAQPEGELRGQPVGEAGRLALPTATGVPPLVTLLMGWEKCLALGFCIISIDPPFLSSARACTGAGSWAHALKAEIGPESFLIWPEGREPFLYPLSVSTLCLLSHAPERELALSGVLAEN